MESALYGIYALVFVSEILLVRCAHSFDFWYVNNSCVNTVRQHFPWSILSLSLSNLHGLSCQEKVSRFSMLLIPRNGTSLAVSHWKLRMVLMVEYRSSRLEQNKPFSGPVSSLLSSSAEFYSSSLSGRLRAVGLNFHVTTPVKLLIAY